MVEKGETYVGVSGEGLGYGGYNDVGDGEDVDVGEGADCVVYDDREVVFIGLAHILSVQCFCPQENGGWICLDDLPIFST